MLPQPPSGACRHYQRGCLPAVTCPESAAAGSKRPLTDTGNRWADAHQAKRRKLTPAQSLPGVSPAEPLPAARLASLALCQLGCRAEPHQARSGGTAGVVQADAQPAAAPAHSKRAKKRQKQDAAHQAAVDPAVHPLVGATQRQPVASQGTAAGPPKGKKRKQRDPLSDAGQQAAPEPDKGKKRKHRDKQAAAANAHAAGQPSSRQQAAGPDLARDMETTGQKWRQSEKRTDVKRGL